MTYLTCLVSWIKWLEIMAWWCMSIFMNCDLLFTMSSEISDFTPYEYVPVACRGLAMPGATARLDGPLPSSSIEQCVWWSLLLYMRCLWRHNMTSYSCLQTNVLSKFVDTTCIFRDPGAAIEKQSRRHGGLSLPNKASRPIKLNYEAL